MSFLTADFDELYRRHLCRHSQFGLNVLHLLAVLGIYFALCGLVSAAASLAGAESPALVIGALTGPYFLLLACNVPARVWFATAVTVAAVVAATSLLPTLPWWVYLLLIVGLHRFQQWSHRIYPLERDMSGFQQKYVKGLRLFLLLSIYELPILVQYLLFGREDWVHGSGTDSGKSSDRVPEPLAGGSL